MSPPPLPGEEDWDDDCEDFGDDDQQSSSGEDFSETDSSNDAPFLRWPDIFDAGTEGSSRANSTAEGEEEEERGDAAVEPRCGEMRLPADFRCLSPSGWCSIYQRFAVLKQSNSDSTVAGVSSGTAPALLQEVASEDYCDPTGMEVASSSCSSGIRPSAPSEALRGRRRQVAVPCGARWTCRASPSYAVCEEEFDRLMSQGSLGPASEDEVFEISEEEFHRLLSAGHLQPSEEACLSRSHEPPSTAPAAVKRPSFSVPDGAAAPMKLRPQSVDAIHAGTWQDNYAEPVGAGLRGTGSCPSSEAEVSFPESSSGSAAGSPLRSARLLRGLKGLPAGTFACKAAGVPGDRLASFSSSSVGSREESHSPSFIRKRPIVGPRATLGRLPEPRGSGRQKKASKGTGRDSGLEDEEVLIRTKKVST